MDIYIFFYKNTANANLWFTNNMIWNIRAQLFKTNDVVS